MIFDCIQYDIDVFNYWSMITYMYYYKKLEMKNKNWKTFFLQFKKIDLNYKKKKSFNLAKNLIKKSF